MTQSCSRQIAMVMIMMLAGASGATNMLRHQKAATETSVKVQKSVQSLQKALDKAIHGAEVREASYLRDDDKDDDDKEEGKEAKDDEAKEDEAKEGEAKDDDAKENDEEAKEDEAEEEELHAAQEKRRQRKEDKVALGEAKNMHKVAESDLEAFADEKSFDQKIAAEVRKITNETQSPALSSFLGEVRTEMRDYAMPNYPNYLEGKVTAAEKKVAELEVELNGKKPAKEDKKEGKDKAASDDKDKENKEKDGDDSKTSQNVEESTEAAVEEANQKAGETWAISFFANVALLAVVFGMANAEHAATKSYTWVLIDQVILIFLAVMYFQAFDSLLDFVDFGGHNHVAASVLHAIIMLSVVLLLAYSLRDHDVGMAIVCGAGAHIVSFCSIHGAAAAQNGVWVSYSNTWTMMVFGICVLGLGLLVIGYLVYTAKKRANVLENDDFMDKTDDLENDFGSMAFSVVFTMFVRFLLTGHHPEDDETEFDHTQTQRHYMLAYACLALLVAAFGTKFFSKKASEAAQANNYAMKRVWNFFTTVSAMNVAWAFLYWGEWEFFEALYPGEAIKGRVMFAIATTVAGGLALIGLAKLSDSTPKGDGTSRSAEKVLITAVSLVVAWSWELCFDAAMDSMTEGAAHPVTLKVGAACTLFAIVIPIYALYVKPAIKANGGDA